MRSFKHSMALALDAGFGCGLFAMAPDILAAMICGSCAESFGSRRCH